MTVIMKKFETLDALNAELAKHPKANVIEAHIYNRISGKDFYYCVVDE